MNRNENSVCQSFNNSFVEENSSELPECDSDFFESHGKNKNSNAVSNIGDSDNVSSFD